MRTPSFFAAGVLLLCAPDVAAQETPGARGEHGLMVPADVPEQRSEARIFGPWLLMGGIAISIGAGFFCGPYVLELNGVGVDDGLAVASTIIGITFELFGALALGYGVERWSRSLSP